MAVIRLKELKEKTPEELQAELLKMQKEISAEYASIKTTGRPKNAGKYKEMKRVKSRIMTLLHQKKGSGMTNEKTKEKTKEKTIEKAKMITKEKPKEKAKEKDKAI